MDTNFLSDLDFSHSELVDQWLGINVPEIERGLLAEALNLLPNGNHKTWGDRLHDGNQTWVGLEPQTLQTPYSEIQRMCDILSPAAGSHIVDLGAGYGRMGIVLGKHYQDVKFTGLEYVKARVIEGQRVLNLYGCKNASLIEADLTSEEFNLPDADIYFIYDYGKVSHIRRTIQQLEKLADQKNIKVIARGKGTRSLIDHEHPWLSQIYPPYHEENFSIYTMSLEDNLSLNVPEGLRR